MAKSIFKFGDKFGIESPFGDWLEDFNNKNDLIKIVEVYLVPNYYNDKEFSEYFNPKKKLSVIIVIDIIGEPHKVEVKHINNENKKDAIYNPISKRYEAELNLQSVEPPKTLPLQVFEIILYDNKNVIIKKQRFSKKYSLHLPDRKTVYGVFYFDKHGMLVDADEDKQWKVYPHAIFTNSEGKKIKIDFQDPKNDNLHYSGLLEEGSTSNFRQQKPVVEALQFINEKELKAILEIDEEILNKMRVHRDFNLKDNEKFVNIFDLAKDNKFDTKKFIQVVDEGFDFGAYLFKEEVMYVINNKGSRFDGFIYEEKWVGLNGKNMGNFMFGVVFQVLGYSPQDASKMAHGWNIVEGMKKESLWKIINWDSADDQRAVIMGFEFSSKILGKPKLKRTVPEISLIKYYLNKSKTSTKD